MDFYGFYTGKVFDAYKYLGAHVTDAGVTFRTFAPSASKISVIGEFNEWEESPMEKVHDGNFWEFTAADAEREARREEIARAAAKDVDDAVIVSHDDDEGEANALF